MSAGCKNRLKQAARRCKLYGASYANGEANAEANGEARPANIFIARQLERAAFAAFGS